MAVKERDPLTGHQMTGHEWNGIKELNTRVPRAVWWFIAVTHVYALIAWILLPSWPGLDTYWRGLLGSEQKEDLQAAIVAREVDRVVWQQGFEDLSLAEIAQDEALMGVVRVTGPALFGDNCAACHGARGQGGPGFPSLTDADWLWGGDPEVIFETIRVGINTRHPDSRFSEMPAFGDGILPRSDIRLLVDYVQSLSGEPMQEADAAAAETLYLDNCSACHGEAARGDDNLGAPDLADGSWIYGGSDEAIYQTIRDGRSGFMPGWEGRLTDVDRKILTLYVQELGRGGIGREEEGPTP